MQMYIHFYCVYYPVSYTHLGLILGFLMLLSPMFTLSTIRYFVSIYLIFLGVDSIIMAFSPGMLPFPAAAFPLRPIRIRKGRSRNDAARSALFLQK